jgi:hypothetical protein
MAKFIVGSILTGIIILLAGMYPHVAVGVTAIAIVLIFKITEWLGE